MSETIPLDKEGQVSLPIVDLLTGRGFITGKSGSGKSNSASVIAEELLDRGLPLLIVDTDGEYWGLKQEFQILHAGADEECDIQVGPEHSEKLASLALEENVPIILDVSGYIDEGDSKQLIQETANQLFIKERDLKKPFLLLVEEVHEYIPEGGGLDDLGKVLVKIGKRGRKRGLGLVGISQRPANVKKDFITQANWLLWHRLTWENDTNVVRTVIDKTHSESITELSDGEAFLQCDFLEEDIITVQVRRKKTFDAGATPDLGEIERPDLKSVGSDLLSELEEISDKKRKEQDTISQLQSEIEAKEKEIQDLQDQLEAERQNNQTVNRLADQLANIAAGEGGAEALDEIREEKNQEIRELRSQVKSLEEEQQEHQQTIATLREENQELQQYKGAIDNLGELEEAVHRMNDALGITGDGESDKFKEKIKSKQERIQELESKVNKLEQEGHSLDEEFQEKMDFIQHPAVKKEIELAANQTDLSSDNTWDAISVLVDADNVPTKEFVPLMNVNKPNTSRILARLREHSITKVEKDGNKNLHSLNIDGMKEIIQQQRKREEMEELKKTVKG